MKDPAGTTHQYSYDQHGRLLHDRVTALPSELDGTVRRISRSYDATGRWTRISSWDQDYLTAPAGQPAPVAVNEVKLEINAWGQLIADRQAHSGLVDAASPAVPVGSVLYGYANGADNHLRRTSMIFPSGRQVLTDYNAEVCGTETPMVSEPRWGSGSIRCMTRWIRRRSRTDRARLLSDTAIARPAQTIRQRSRPTLRLTTSQILSMTTIRRHTRMLPAGRK